MKTILEIQRLDQKIRLLNREVDLCQASKNFSDYLKVLKEGRERFEKFEVQATEIISNFGSKVFICFSNSAILGATSWRFSSIFALNKVERFFASVNFWLNSALLRTISSDLRKYAKYKSMKENGIFPVFVALEGDFCGGCKVELPLNFIEKLKVAKMLPCEHCNRIIVATKK